MTSEDPRTLSLEYLADVAPDVFENIAHNMDRTSIFAMLQTSKLLRRSIQSMMNAKKRERRLLPYRDVTVVISRTSWDFGFNRIKFYGFTDRAIREKNTDIVRTMKPFGKRGLTEMTMDVLAKDLQEFGPKKIVFDMDNKFGMITSHLKFMETLDVVPGTTTEVLRSAGHNIPDLCTITKPKKLILVGCRIAKTDEEDYFADSAFQNLQHLVFRDKNASYPQAAQGFNLEPISEQLMSFDFSGCIPYFPNQQVNILLQKWSNGKSPLKTIKILAVFDNTPPTWNFIGHFAGGNIGPNQMVIPGGGGIQMLFGAEDRNPGWNHIESSELLEGIKNTTVDRFDQLPDFMQKKIVEDLVGMDWKSAEISYHLLLCPSKRQMGCLFYSRSIDMAPLNGQPANNGFACLGFHSFDYFPVKETS